MPKKPARKASRKSSRKPAPKAARKSARKPARKAAPARKAKASAAPRAAKKRPARKATQSRGAPVTRATGSGAASPRSAPARAPRPDVEWTTHRVLAELKSLAEDGARAELLRRGAREPVLGVPDDAMAALASTLGTRHELAVALWSAGNYDARVLATRIADPALLAPAQLDRWVGEIDSALLADEFAPMVARTPLDMAHRCIQEWTASTSDLVRRAGYGVVASRLRHRAGKPFDQGADLPDPVLRSLVRTIELDVRSSASRARHGMMLALIAVGRHRPSLHSDALAAARRIGPMPIDQSAPIDAAASLAAAS